MNVLKITTTPIRLSMTSQRARLDSEIPDPEIGIIQNPGRLNMKSENIKVNIDTSRSRDSMGFKTARGLMSDRNDLSKSKKQKICDDWYGDRNGLHGGGSSGIKCLFAPSGLRKSFWHAGGGFCGYGSAAHSCD